MKHGFRYYIDGKRVTYADYLDAIDNHLTHETFLTKVKDGKFYHYSNVR
jgi:hypothetical protein